MFETALAWWDRDKSATGNILINYASYWMAEDSIGHRSGLDIQPLDASQVKCQVAQWIHHPWITHESIRRCISAKHRTQCTEQQIANRLPAAPPHSSAAAEEEQSAPQHGWAPGPHPRGGASADSNAKGSWSANEMCFGQIVLAVLQPRGSVCSVHDHDGFMFLSS